MNVERPRGQVEPAVRGRTAESKPLAWYPLTTDGLMAAINDVNRLQAEIQRLSYQLDTVTDTLRMIAEKKRRTKEQRLANSCLMFLEALDVPPNTGAQQPPLPDGQ